jgi:hypothetical protein
MTRCGACGATNPERAAWCGQCYAVLRPPAEAPEDVPAMVGAPAGAATATDGVAADASARRPHEGFRRRGDVVEWHCVRCESYTSIELFACGVCGTSLAARYDRAAEPLAHNWRAALALSALLPGAGHIAVQRYGSGIARALLFVTWALGAVYLFGAGSRAAAAATPMLLGALVLWLGSLADLVQLQRAEREVVNGRMLLWLVLGVTILSAVGMAAGAGLAGQ